MFIYLPFNHVGRWFNHWNQESQIPKIAFKTKVNRDCDHFVLKCNHWLCWDVVCWHWSWHDYNVIIIDPFLRLRREEIEKPLLGPVELHLRWNRSVRMQIINPSIHATIDGFFVLFLSVRRYHRKEKTCIFHYVLYCIVSAFGWECNTWDCITYI